MLKTSSKRSHYKRIAVALAVMVFSLVFLYGGFASAGDKITSHEKAFVIKKKSSKSKKSVRLNVEDAWSKKLATRTPWGKIKTLKSPGVSSRPTIHEDTLYIGVDKKVFYAFDLSKGKIRWKFKTASPVDGDGAVDGDMVCFGTVAGVLHCVNKDTGEEFWSFNARSEIITAPVITAGRVFFTSTEDKVYALDRKSGKKLWSYTGISPHYVMPRIVTSPVLSRTGAEKRLFVLLANGSLLCLDTERGKEIWSKKVITSKINVVESARRKLVARGDEIFIIDDRGVIVVHSQKDGKLKSSYPIIKTIDFVVNGKNIYLLGEELLVAVERKSGKVLWSTEHDHGKPALIAPTKRHLVIIFNELIIPFDIKYLKRVSGYASAYTMDTGDEAWQRKFRLPLTSVTVGNGKTMALVNSKGVLRVFNVE